MIFFNRLDRDDFYNIVRPFPNLIEDIIKIANLRNENTLIFEERVAHTGK